MSNNSYARFARAFFIFKHFADVLVLSSKWPFDLTVVSTTWAYDDKCSIQSYLWGAGSNLIPGWLEHILQMKWLQKREVAFSSDVLAFARPTPSLLKFSTRLSTGSRINLANLRNLAPFQHVSTSIHWTSLHNGSTQISRDEVRDIQYSESALRQSSLLFLIGRWWVRLASVQTPRIISPAHHRKKKRKPYLFIFQGNKNHFSY